jgi:hypothetical protein
MISLSIFILFATTAVIVAAAIATFSGGSLEQLVWTATYAPDKTTRRLGHLTRSSDPEYISHNRNLDGGNNDGDIATIDYSAEGPSSENVHKYTPHDSDAISASNGAGGYIVNEQRSLIMNVRFNKCPPIAEEYAAPSMEYVSGVHKNIFPLLPWDYPLGGTKATLLRNETMADSVILESDFQVFGSSPEHWMALVKPPSYPIANPNAPYWEELRQVVRAQLARRRGDDPATLSRWPDLWADFDLEDIAKAVQGEYPASLQQGLIMHTLANGGLEMDKSLMPFRSVVDFIGKEVRIAALNTWAFDAVAPINFMLKWYNGMPRPEEMAWLIASGQFGVNDGVPEDIVNDLVGMNLANATDFTAYP